MARNPFRPTAGASPPLLVGREDQLEEFTEALEDGPGAPGRLTLFTGPRGVGKTVMLTEVGEIALGAGWITVAETSTLGLVDRLIHQVVRAVDEHNPAAPSRRQWTGLTLPFGAGGATWSAPAEAVQLREQIGYLLDGLEERGSGLLITVDEVHSGAREDLRALAAIFQHLVREDRDIALVLAGLPSAVSGLLSDEVLTFLRRATRYELADVELGEVRIALNQTITEQGREIDAQALDIAAQATGGYPFMIQLVGYHVWRTARGGPITLETVSTGVQGARKRLGSTVHETALADLSGVDRTFLVAMSQDDGPSRTSQIAERMNVALSYASVYRRRLIDARVIEPARYGYVDYAIPYLREYLREHAAAQEMTTRSPEGN